MSHKCQRCPAILPEDYTLRTCASCQKKQSETGKAHRDQIKADHKCLDCQIVMPKGYSKTRCSDCLEVRRLNDKERRKTDLHQVVMDRIHNHLTADRKSGREIDQNRRYIDEDCFDTFYHLINDDYGGCCPNCGQEIHWFAEFFQDPQCWSWNRLENSLSHYYDNCEMVCFKCQMDKARGLGGKPKKAVIATVIETGEELPMFSSCHEAGKALGLHFQNINLCCNGDRRKHNGYTFRFA